MLGESPGPPGGRYDAVQPAFWANRAICHAPGSRASDANLREGSLSILVRIVIAEQLGKLTLSTPGSSLAFAAARIISTPPRAWTSKNCNPGKPMALDYSPFDSVRDIVKFEVQEYTGTQPV